MQRIVTVLLQMYALFLAWLHSLGGVQTDEAKYLLDIPYPHPPLLRWIMGLTSTIPFQEMLWRVALATLLVQAVWLVWDMTRALPRPARIAAASAWLLSPSVFVQGGTVMLAPVTALVALSMLWLLHRQKNGTSVTPETWGFLWATALLSAYQGVVLLPLAVAGAWRADGSAWRKIGAVVLPVVLLAIVTLGNPLALATMLIHADEGVRLTLAEHTEGALGLWLFAGAWVVSVIGVVGLLMQRRWEILGGFTLTTLFVLGSASFPFYAILFLPWITEGVRAVVQSIPACRGKAFSVFLIAGIALGWLWIPPILHISLAPSEARLVMRKVAEHVTVGEVAISGSFGHQWQYESPLPVRRYVLGKLDGIVAVVCLDPCEEPQGWLKIDAPVDAWVRS
jgi:hypothetical protein